jgi:hypothetical protein
VPAADAGRRLPRLRPDLVEKAALDILDDAVTLIVRQLLGGQHDVEARRCGQGCDCNNGRPRRFRLAERQPIIVHVDEVRIVFLDQVDLALEPVAHEAGILWRRVLQPLAVAGIVPGVHLGDAVEPSGGAKLGPV